MVFAAALACSGLEQDRSVTLFYLGFIDLIVFIGLFAAACLESKYMPATLSGCNQIRVPQPETSSPNLFVFLGQIQQEPARASCRRLMTVRILGIVLL